MVEFNLPVSAGIGIAIIAAGMGGLYIGDMMGESTLFMMVLPSMVAFAGIMFAIGVKHGEFRATSP
jgi:hypothetical protein